MVRVFQLCIQFWVIEVDIGDTFSILNFLWLVNAELVISNRKLLELHNILC